MTFSPVRQLRKAILSALPTKSGSDKQVVATVMQGFRMTLEDSHFDELLLRLNAVDVDARGFTYEGAGVGYAVFDYMMPWRKQLRDFVRVIEDHYIIPVYIGAGLALGRMKSGGTERYLKQQEHPVFRWMVMDGFGFYRGFFAPQITIEKQVVPKNLSPYARHVFDQGLGRAIWFARDEQVERVLVTVDAFSEERKADIWSGVGFACAYAGSAIERGALNRLWEGAKPYQLQLALAGAFAAKRRVGLGHVTPHTEMACQVFCGLSAEMAATVANDALEALPSEESIPLHKIWRDRVTAYFEKQVASANEPTK